MIRYAHQPPLDLPATRDEIRAAITAWYGAECKRLGVQKPIGPVARWVYILYLTVHDVAPYCAGPVQKDELRAVIRTDFRRWRAEAEANGWQPTDRMAADPWWREGGTQ